MPTGAMSAEEQPLQLGVQPTAQFASHALPSMHTSTHESEGGVYAQS
jgi:hypothetical protein